MRLLHSISYSFKEIKRRYNSIINDGKDYSNQQVEIVIDSISFRVDKASSEVDDLKKVITKYILRSSILKGQLNDPTAIEKLNQIIINWS